MKKSIAFVAILATCTSAFSVTLESLNREQMVKTFVNKTAVSIGTDIFNGEVVPKTFSFYLDYKGNVKGKFGVKPKHEPQTDVGVYTIEKDGTIYVTWKHWYGSKKICFRLFNSENAYLSLECNNVFHTAYLKSAITPGDHIS
jgi:hypothetical protein